MTTHEMELPNKVIVGHNIDEIIVELIRQAAGSNHVLVVTSKTPYTLLAKQVVEELAKTGVSVSDMIIADSSLQTVVDVTARANSKKTSLIAGVGGGKVLDVAKAASHSSNARFVSVPTVASHDGIASPMASIRGSGQIFSQKTRMPIAIIADIDIIQSAPYRYLSSGCGDLVAKYTAVTDWRLSHNATGEYFGEYAAELASLSAEIVMRKASEIGAKKTDSVRTVLEALISSGVSMGIAGSSRPCSGSEHLISHAIESLVEDPPLHGERCGLATIIAAYLHNLDWRRVRESLRLIGAPTSAREIGLERDVLIEAIMKAPKIRPDRYTVLTTIGLDRKKIEDILAKIEVI